ncbi:hypothetical protein TPAR_03512 [Tolypocladium paradoxum]|uniref:Uncharacterized protein n=1 Tax=Tolypocladium paradoxum TaxID=94208 RepID=A0A2S4L1I5_9HYPO|nr:hypothetical protein TPAR_03512 [Tolypocladium paradoxum]
MAHVADDAAVAVAAAHDALHRVVGYHRLPGAHDPRRVQPAPHPRARSASPGAQGLVVDARQGRAKVWRRVSAADTACAVRRC